ncbi:MAG: hypothetical protein PGN26_11745 [Xylophilus ampelinus]
MPAAPAPSSALPGAPSSPSPLRGRRAAASAALLLACGAAWAQAPAAPPADPQQAPAAGGRPERRIERITVEDGGSRVDEVRYGGQTQSITVQPKVGTTTPYDISPTDGARQKPAPRDGGTGPDAGQRTWRLLGF